MRRSIITCAPGHSLPLPFAPPQFYVLLPNSPELDPPYDSAPLGTDDNLRLSAAQGHRIALKIFRHPGLETVRQAM